MLIDCPKCGFHQPKDQFCANCGVDMDHFVPKRSLSKIILSSSIFYGLLIFVVIGSTGYFLIKRKSEFRGQADLTQVAAPKSFEGSQNTYEIKQEPKTKTFGFGQKPMAKTANPTHSKIHKTESAEDSSQTSSPAEPVFDPKKVSLTLKIVEVPIERSDTLFGFSNYGVIRDYLKSLNRAELEEGLQIETLDSVNWKNIERGRTFAFEREILEESIGEKIGLGLRIQISNITQNSLTAIMEADASVIETQGANQSALKEAYAENLNIPIGGAVYFSGILPRPSQPPKQASELRSRILRAAHSERYIASAPSADIILVLYTTYSASRQ